MKKVLSPSTVGRRAPSRSPQRRRRLALGRPGTCLATGMVSALAATTASAQLAPPIPPGANFFWDANGATLGAGANPTGTWGGAAASPFWSNDTTGGSATTATGPGVNDNANFTAFSIAAGAVNPAGNYTVTLGAAQSVYGLVLGNVSVPTPNTADGSPTFTGTGAPGLTIGAGGVTLVASSGDPVFNANLGTITLGADQTWSINNLHVINTAAPVAGNAAAGSTRNWTLGFVGAYNPTFSGVISNGTAGGNLALTVNNLNSTGTALGGGTWTITGTNNSFTGGVNVAAGNLQFNTVANTGVNSSLGAGGTIGLGSGANVASLTYNGGAASTTNRTVNLAGTTGAVSIINNVGNAANTLSFTSALTNTGAGAKTLTFGGTNLGNNTFGGALVDSSDPAGGALTVAKTGPGVWVLGGANTYTGGTNITGGTLSVNASGTLGVGNFITIGGNGTSGNLSLSAATNFDPNTQNIVLNSGGIGVAFTPAAPPTITDNTGTAGGVYGINYVGTGGVTSQAAGSLYSGYFFLGSFTNGTFTGTSLEAGNGLDQFSINGTYRLGGGGGTLTIQNNVLTGSNDLLIGGTGGGNVILPNANTYTGTTVLQNGSVTVTTLGNVGAASSSLGAPVDAASGTITIGSGANTATLNHTGPGETTNRIINVAGTGGTAIIQNSGTSALNFTSAPTFTETGAKTLQLGAATDAVGGSIGAITDSTTATAKTSLAKAGLTNSTWTIGASTYTGNTTITGGVLASPDVLTNSPVITISGTNVNNTAIPSNLAILQTNGTFARNVSTNGTTPGVVLAGAGGGFAAQGGRLTVTLNGGAALTLGTAGFFPQNATFSFGSTTANNQVEFTNGFSLAANDAFQRPIFVERGLGGDSALLSGIITNTPASTTSNPGIIKQGRGTLILSGANTFSGVLTVSAGSVVAGRDSSGAAGTTSGAFGTGTGQGSAPTIPSAILMGDGNTGAGGNPAVLIGGAFNVGRRITVGDNGTGNAYSIGGTTDGTATFSGAITTIAGTSATALNTFSVTQVATTGANALNLTGGISAASAGTKTVNFNNVGAVNVTTAPIANGTGVLAVTKANVGTLNLGVANTYTGGTTVSGGTLLVNGGAFNATTPATSTSGTGIGAVTVGNAAGTLTGTLGGTGTINLGALAATVLTVNSGSTLSPGNSPGILTVVGAQTGVPAAGAATVNLLAGSTFVMELGGTTAGNGLGFYDQVVLNGTLSLAGNLNVSLFGGFTPADGSTYTIFNLAGATAAETGTFAGITSPAGYTALVNYAGGDGNDVVLTLSTAVPEPSTWATLALGLLGLAGFTRHQRRRSARLA